MPVGTWNALENVMQTGKFPPSLLKKLLDKNPVSDARVVLGPLLGEDAAAVDMGENLLIASSDPVTFASDQAGWYAVHVNANDVATTGAIPKWFLATLQYVKRITMTTGHCRDVVATVSCWLVSNIELL